MGFVGLGLLANYYPNTFFGIIAMALLGLTILNLRGWIQNNMDNKRLLTSNIRSRNRALFALRTLLICLPILAFSIFCFYGAYQAFLGPEVFEIIKRSSGRGFPPGIYSKWTMMAFIGFMGSAFGTFSLQIIFNCFVIIGSKETFLKLQNENKK